MSFEEIKQLIRNQDLTFVFSSPSVKIGGWKQDSFKDETFIQTATHAVMLLSLSAWSSFLVLSCSWKKNSFCIQGTQSVHGYLLCQNFYV